MPFLIETSRLSLRTFIPQDGMHFYKMNNDPDVLKFTRDLPFKDTKAAQGFIETYIANSNCSATRYAVINKTDQSFLGWCGLKYHPEKRYADIGFRFYKQHWNKGYATESALGVIKYAFNTLKLPFLVAHVHIDNKASQRVLSKIGMTPKEKIEYDNQPSFLYQLDNPHYILKQISAKETYPVRHPVLRAGRPLKDVYMEGDDMESTFHLGLFYKGEIVGVASFMNDSFKSFTGTQSRLRGMAVLPDYRKKGLAEIILKKAEVILQKRGCTLLWFNARIVAVNFYKNLNYKIASDSFDIPKVGPHYRMKKEL